MKIKTERDRGVRPRKFRVGGKDHYKVKIELDPESVDLAKVAEVEYKLHPSFKERVRKATDRDQNFAQELWTYGYFPIEVAIKFEDGAVETFVDELHFD